MSLRIGGQLVSPLSSIDRGGDVVGTFVNTTPDAVLDIVDIIYPIGSIYLSVNSANPSTLFGGTWVQIKDKFLLSAGDTYDGGDTGGSVTHTHNYGISLGSYYNLPTYEGDELSGVLTYDSSNNVTVAPNGDGASYKATALFNSAGTTTTTSRSSAYHPRSIGNTSYEETLPPYLAVYVWQRTA